MPTGMTASNMSAIQGQLKSGSYILTVDSSGNLTFTPTSTTSMAPLPSAEARSLAVNQGCPLLSTPSTSLEAPRQNVTPEEVLPHPRVAQIGPRITRSKNRGSSRVLTNSPEMARLKETYDAKVLKESNQLLKESSNIPKKTQRKVRYVCYCITFLKD